MIRMILTASAAMALFAAGQAAAMQNNPDGTTAEERSNTARLNADQLAKAKAETQTYEAEVAVRDQQEAATHSEFAKETEAYEAEKARVAALSAEERIQWEADVAACKGGDTTRCAKPQPQN